MFEQDVFSLNPVEFFALSFDCPLLSPNKQFPSLEEHALPSTQRLTREESFAQIALGWSEEGIGVLALIDEPTTVSCYPHVEQGDSVELFFDTRDLKSSGFNTRFCHHFFFLPHAVEGMTKGEKTHFRTEDSHPLCDSESIHCQTLLKKNGYQMKIFIPGQCLYGYDPRQFNRLGFTYRINRHEGRPQHFSVVSEDYQLDEQPSLWSSLVLLPKESN